MYQVVKKFTNIISKIWSYITLCTTTTLDCEPEIKYEWDIKV